MRILVALLLVSALANPAYGQEDGWALYHEKCASCHGQNLEGQPNWRQRKDDGKLPAPPHDETGHTWEHSDRLLFDVVKRGVAAIVPNSETDMPGFADTMTDAEIRAVIDYIKSTWPPRQKKLQSRVSKEDPYP